MVWIVYFRRGASLDGRAESVKKYGAPVAMTERELANAVRSGRLQGNSAVESNYFVTASSDEVLRYFGLEAVASACSVAFPALLATVREAAQKAAAGAP